MTAQSAPSRREQTSRRISRSAQELAIEHGFEGFTLDDLAARAEVSRRTLFNYFPGKEAAVLGGPDCIDEAHVGVFLSGGPTGQLLRDLGHLVVSIYTSQDARREDWLRIHALFERNPRLLVSSKQQFEEVISQVRNLIAEREGLPPDHPRPRVAVAVVVGLFHDALATFLTDDSLDFPTVFLDGVDEATRLLA